MTSAEEPSNWRIEHVDVILGGSPCKIVQGGSHAPLPSSMINVEWTMDGGRGGEDDDDDDDISLPSSAHPLNRTEDGGG